MQMNFLHVAFMLFIAASARCEERGMLSFTIASGRNQYFHSEEIFINLKAKNVSEKDIRYLPQGRFISGLSLILIDENGNRVPPSETESPLGVKYVGEERIKTLTPLNETEAEYPLLQKYRDLKPGKYNLSASLKLDKYEWGLTEGTSLSNTIQFEVKAWEAKSEKKLNEESRLWLTQTKSDLVFLEFRPTQMNSEYRRIVWLESAKDLSRFYWKVEGKDVYLVNSIDDKPKLYIIDVARYSVKNHALDSLK